MKTRLVISISVALAIGLPSLQAQTTPTPSPSPAKPRALLPNRATTGAGAATLATVPNRPAATPAGGPNKVPPAQNSTASTSILTVISSKNKPMTAENTANPPVVPRLTATEKQQALSGKIGTTVIKLDTQHLQVESPEVSASLAFVLGSVNANQANLEPAGKGRGVYLIIKPTAVGQRFLVDLTLLPPEGDLKKMLLNGSPYQPAIGAKQHMLFEAFAEDGNPISVDIGSFSKLWSFYSCELTVLK